MARGGSRLGAGRKPKPLYVVPPGASASTGAPADVPSAPKKPLPVPEELTKAERAIWKQYAPLAQALGRLTPEKVPGFIDLCRDVVTCLALKKQIDEEGWTTLKVVIDGAGQEHQQQTRHTLWPQLQFYTVRREQLMTRYGLLADGKPVAPPPAPTANPWSTI